MTRGNEKDPPTEEPNQPLDDSTKISRRTVLKGVAVVAGAALAEAGCDADQEQPPWTGGTGGSGGSGGSPQDAGTGGGSGGQAGAGGGDADAEADAYTPPDMTNRVIVARNGTPPQNVAAALGLAGGIERFIDQDDVVVLKPNGQWRRQGYTHTECMKALIDEILGRPGGFNGEVIIAEHVHRGVTESMAGDYCWNISAGDNRLNNWPDMSYLELVQHYHDNGAPNVTAAPLYDSGGSTGFSSVTGPGELTTGQSGWVRTTYTTTSTGGTVRLSHPIIRSSHSDRLIDLKDGVWDNGS
ncbi:MAG: hypothetical protein JRI68_35315, partial [Deltaproteobacteria bacterium]|nr:hypothetical protein [Deltaproteobacteria bacterium]